MDDLYNFNNHQESILSDYAWSWPFHDYPWALMIVHDQLFYYQFNMWNDYFLTIKLLFSKNFSQ